MSSLAVPSGQGWRQLGELALAFGLSSLIGCLGDRLHRRWSHIVRGDAVRGLTTAAIVWITAAIGMACGAGLALLAIMVTVGHFIVVFVYPGLAARLPRSRYVGFGLRVVYEDGRGILRQILGESTRLGFTIASVKTHQLDGDVGGRPAVAVTLELQGQPSADHLTLDLNELDGVP